jgi:branched-chain amino acid transport system ATP-binding protein
MAASNALLAVQGVTKRFGGFTALDSVDLNIGVGERLGLIGPNGSGKSTLVNCITGVYIAEEGAIQFDGHDISRLPAHQRIRRGLARSFQIPKPFGSMSVVENLCVPLMYAGAKRSESDARSEAMQILKDIGLDARANEKSSGLTQVDMRKLELARAMAAKPKLLISDEAMAGLSNMEVDDIIKLLLKLKEQNIAVIMIEHIMRAVVNFSDRVVVLDAGKKIAEGDPQSVMKNPLVEKAYLGE